MVFSSFSQQKSGRRKACIAYLIPQSRTSSIVHATSHKEQEKRHPVSFTIERT